uniref:Uncharacterized protein n=2 Tax=Cyclopterus lumpus TaxID=8103 RepID=A0A8C2Z6X9_CYCLU
MLTEEQLWCCICLDVFNEPVTIPCGHNFCKACIKQHLTSNPQRQCPMCNERVDRKCKLGVNTLISEMTVQYRLSAGRKDGKSSEQRDAEPGEVSCDAPPGTHLLPSFWTALRFRFFLVFSLLCVTICCFTMTRCLHQMAPGLKTHQPFDAVEKAVGSVCPKHGRPLELYCKNEQMPICQSCAGSNHRFHDVVALKEEYEAKFKDLQETQAVIQQKIQERQQKIQEVKHTVSLSCEAADRQLADGVQVFAALTKTVDENQAQVLGWISAMHQTTVKQAEGFVEELELEISELTERRTEVEQLSRLEDHLHFLQSFPFLNTAPLARDLPDVSIPPASYKGVLRMAVVVAVSQLREKATREMKKLQEAEPWSFSWNAVNVTLDADTAHPELIVSDDGKRVDYSGVWNKVPDNPKRFDRLCCVLGKQSFSFRRFYYDVQVKGETAWILGVAKESVNRKGEVQRNSKNGIWALFHIQGDQYVPLTGQFEPLTVKDAPGKVRVFVDYKEGLVSFYNVDSAALIYSFTGCSFTERLHPFFCPLHKDSTLLTTAVGEIK